MIGLWLFVVLVGIVILFVKQQSSSNQIEELQRRLDWAEDELHRVSKIVETRRPTTAPTAPVLGTVRSPVHPESKTTPASVPPPLPVVVIRPPSIPREPPIISAPSAAARAAVPPLMPSEPPPVPAPVRMASSGASEPPVPKKVAPPEWLSVNWENFLGVKLFAWVGGLALFLGVAFFVKWSFDRNLITPLMRVIIGAVTGLGLIVGGLRISRARYMVTVQTLCATGIVVLYADCFAAYAYYPFMGATPAFAVMGMITVAAFTLAVRLDAQVIAVLGLLGGFLTPLLLSTGRDYPVGLFGYLAVLDAGLIAVALRKQWTYLVLLAAGATGFMEMGWVNAFFEPHKLATAMTVFLGFSMLFIGALAAAQRRERLDKWVGTAGILMPCMAMLFGLYLVGRPYPALEAQSWGLFGYLFAVDVLMLGLVLWRKWNPLAFVAAAGTLVVEWLWVGEFFAPAKILMTMGVFFGFAALFVGALGAADRREPLDKWLRAAAVLMPSMAMAFGLYVLGRGRPELVNRVWLLFGYVFAVDLLYLAMAWLRQELRVVHLLAGGAVFVLLMRWTVEFLTPALLTPALILFLIFAVLHSIFPLVLARAKPSSLSLKWAHVAPPMALLLILVPLFKLAESSFLVWPVVLLIDLMAIFMAVLTGSLVSILAVFALTVLATALWIFQLPPSLAEVPGMLVVIAGFAIFFMGAALLAARKVLGPSPENETAGTPSVARVAFDQLASMAAVLPFLLLSLVVLRLPLSNPAPVFGVAALLVVMLLATTRLLSNEWLPLVTLGSVAWVEWTWHFERFTPALPSGAIAWYLGFSALVLVFPFLFRERFAAKTGPWVAAALALPIHFPILYRAIKESAPDFEYLGLIPAALAVPCFLGLLALIRPRPVEGRVRLGQVALFGGATLLFVTLIFPIQFERQWITIGWALEGTALLWLFRRVPHPGLKLVGAGLLVAGFARLALNPWVFAAYGRTGTPILNWYLYAFGIVAACQLVGAWLLAKRGPETEDGFSGIQEFPVVPLLCTLGTLLAFLLLNIEIADCFSPRGGPLVFHLSANFEQDMTYSLAWAIFAFALLAIGLVTRNAATRYAGMGLIGITVLKLFLHDLWWLTGLLRVGSLVGLAIVLLVVSLIYQRFLATGTQKEKPTM